MIGSQAKASLLFAKEQQHRCACSVSKSTERGGLLDEAKESARLRKPWMHMHYTAAEIKWAKPAQEHLCTHTEYKKYKYILIQQRKEGQTYAHT